MPRASLEEEDGGDEDCCVEAVFVSACALGRVAEDYVLVVDAVELLVGSPLFLKVEVGVPAHG